MEDYLSVNKITSDNLWINELYVGYVRAVQLNSNMLEQSSEHSLDICLSPISFDKGFHRY